MKDQFHSFIAKQKHLLRPVVPFKAGADILVGVDLSVETGTLSSHVFNNIGFFSSYMDKLRKDANALYAIGGYAEHRQMYSFSPVFDASNVDDEPRRLHLGVDIWGEANTLVMSPLDGIVHSTGFHSAAGDYGGTIILEHAADGFSFYTLYGHLSAKSVQENWQGKLIPAGETFAETGLPFENGYWPPHLHFQIILDMEDRLGDYPGVCRYSEKEKWLANSPDGDILLGLNKYLKPSG